MAAIAVDVHQDHIDAIGKSVGNRQENHLAAFREEVALGGASLTWRNGGMCSRSGKRPMSTSLTSADSALRYNNAQRRNVNGASPPGTTIVQNTPATHVGAHLILDESELSAKYEVAGQRGFG